MAPKKKKPLRRKIRKPMPPPSKAFRDESKYDRARKKRRRELENGAN